MKAKVTGAVEGLLIDQIAVAQAVETAANPAATELSEELVVVAAAAVVVVVVVVAVPAVAVSDESSTEVARRERWIHQRL
jgi:hypothetical protein